VDEVGGLPWDPNHPVWKAFRKHEEFRADQRAKYGEVRDIISTEFKGKRVVAVGDQLFIEDSGKTFVDFLFAYMKHALGSEWGNGELAKPLSERHEVMKWYDHWCRVQAETEPDEDGIYATMPDGICSAYVNLAYDLYVLRHHAKLQDDVLQRIRKKDQFRGARYELLVTATFIRAGFDVEFEDESDGSKKHPEFTAIHKETGLRVDLEAKCRVRDVSATLRRPPEAPRVDSLLEDAAAKAGDLPYVACVELALPPGGSEGIPDWVPKVQQELASVVDQRNGDNPFDLVFFTNIPHQYGELGGSDPARHYYAVWPNDSRIPESLVDALGGAFKQYGRIPIEFPPESFMDSV